MKVELTWNISDDERIRGFDVYRKWNETSHELSIVGEELLAPNERRFIDNDVRFGMTYHYVVSAVMSDGSEIRSHPETINVKILSLALSQNYPNPFNPVTRIGYTLPQSAEMSLKIYDVQGKFIVTLEEGVRSEGTHKVTWDGRDSEGNAVSTGMFFYRLKAGSTIITKKMVILK